MSTWVGIKVKHVDGRSGFIRSDYLGFLHRVLAIDVADAEEDYVQLNANGPDTGSAGWSWWCEDFASGSTWLALGDHA